MNRIIQSLKSVFRLLFFPVQMQAKVIAGLSGYRYIFTFYKYSRNRHLMLTVIFHLSCGTAVTGT